MHTGGYENVDEPNGADGKDYELVSCIFAEGLDKPVARGAMPRATVGLEDR